VDQAQLGARQPHHRTSRLTSVTTPTPAVAATSPLAPPPIAIMSDNENGDELVTKPFKFVTGKLPPRLHDPGL